MTKQTNTFRRRLGSFFMELAGASSSRTPFLDKSLRQQADARSRDGE